MFFRVDDEIMNLLKGLETFLSQKDRLKTNVSIDVDIARRGRELVKPFFQNYHDFFGHELKSSFKTSLIHSIAHAMLVNICRC